MCTTTKHRDRVRRIPRRKITSRFGGREGVKTGQEGRHQGDTGRGMWRWSRTLEEIEGEARWAGGAGWEGEAHAHSQPPTCALARGLPPPRAGATPSAGPAGLRWSVSTIVTNLPALLSQAPDAPSHTPSGDKGEGQHRVHLLRKGGLSATVSTSAPLSGPSTAPHLLPSLPTLPVPNTQGQGLGPIGRARASQSLGTGSCVHVGRAGTSLSPPLWETPRLGEGGAGTAI